MFIYLSIIFIAISSRLIEHPANVAPIAAIAIFVGYLHQPGFQKWKNNLLLILPFVALIISDYFIGFYDKSIMIVVYSSYLITIIISKVMRKYYSWLSIIAVSLLGSVIFYLATNWAVWQFTSLYEPTFSGLINSYIAAIPFFRNSIIGDLIYTISFFAVYELATNQDKVLKIVKMKFNQLKEVS